MRRSLFLALALLAWAFPAAAQAQDNVHAPLADRIPPDALIYAGWCGAQRAQQLSAGSHTQALLEASQFPIFFERTVPQLGQALARQNPESRPWVKALTEVCPILFQHPTALAFGGVDWDHPGQPLPRLLLICDAGEDAPVLRARLTQLFQSLRRVELVTLMDVQDGVLYLNLGWHKLDLAMADQDNRRSLIAETRFTQTLTDLSTDPLTVLFVDVPGIIELLEEGARRNGDEQEVQNRQTFLAATGLSAVGSMAATSSFDDGLYRTDAFVETRGARTGLLSLLDDQPVDVELLRAIPADAGFVAAGRLDLSRVLEAVRNAVLVVQPNAVGDFEQGLQFINLLVGANVEDDLFAATGSTWAAYVAPATGDSALGVVAVNRPDNPAKVRGAMTNLWLSLTSFANQQLRDNGESFRLINREIKRAEGNFHLLDLPLVAPTWCVGERYAFVGLYPQSVAGAIAMLPGEGENFASTDTFAALQALAGDHPIRGFTWIDLPRYSGRSYTLLNAWVQLGSGMISSYGESAGLNTRAPPMLLPPYPLIREHLAPARSVTFVTDRGLHFRSVEPFPFSLLFGAGLQ